MGIFSMACLNGPLRPAAWVQPFIPARVARALLFVQRTDRFKGQRRKSYTDSVTLEGKIWKQKM
jgi:hypothetical protein